MVTKEQIQQVLARTDEIGMHAVGRALVHLYNRQTTQEQATECTIEHNGRGFTGADGHIGASMEKYYMNNKFLTAKQVSYWQKNTASGSSKIGKYWKQIQEEAEKKKA